MPGTTGPDFHKGRKLRREEIPIIFITAAHGDERIRQGLLESGAVACMVKPFSDAELLEALNAALR
jgi:FixJ family two-component response regulator